MTRTITRNPVAAPATLKLSKTKAATPQTQTTYPGPNTTVLTPIPNSSGYFSTAAKPGSGKLRPGDQDYYSAES
jgi:hypothetical protein